MPSRPRRSLELRALVVVIGVALVGACGDDDEPEQQPDEVSFCRLALANEPVAEASAPVWRRLDELAPSEIDDAAVVLREAAEELEELTPNSPEAIAAEFDIRFRDDYLAARDEVDAFVATECADYRATTTTDGDGTTTTDPSGPTTTAPRSLTTAEIDDEENDP